MVKAGAQKVVAGLRANPLPEFHADKETFDMTGQMLAAMNEVEQKDRMRLPGRSWVSGNTEPLISGRMQSKELSQKWNFINRPVNQRECRNWGILNFFPRWWLGIHSFMSCN